MKLKVDLDLLGGKGSIKELTVANMFRIFKDYLEDRNHSQDNEHEKRKLIGLFERTFQNVETVKNEYDDRNLDPLDMLLRVGEATAQYKTLSELTELFVRFIDIDNIEVEAITSYPTRKKELLYELKQIIEEGCFKEITIEVYGL